MKTITLDRLTILNFKGGQGTYNFSNSNTSVYGANGSGKTRLADAFTWLLFNKNTKGQSSFEIKPLDKDNNPISRVPVEVSADIYVNNELVVLSKTYEENWVRPRGSETEILKGHTITYKINDVPISEREYNIKVSEICEEKTFLLLTNPQAFTALHWEAQRELLITMSKLPAAQLLFIGNNDMLDLLERMSGKDEDEYRALVASKIKKCKEELKGIEPAIREQRRSLPEEVDYKAIEREHEAAEARVKEISEQLSQVDKESEAITNKALESSRKVTEIKLAMDTLRAEDKKSVMSKYYEEVESWQKNTSELRKHLLEHKQISDRLTALAQEITVIEKRKEDLKADWHKENSRKLEFREDELYCQHCGSPYEADKAIEIREKASQIFNIEKAEKLKAITKEGQGCNARLDAINAEIKDLAEDRAKINTAIEGVKKICNASEPIPPIYEYHPSEEYIKLQNQVIELESKANETQEESEAHNAKAQLSIELHDAIASSRKLFEKLSERTQKDRIIKRIKELEESERAISAELAKHEQEERLINKYSRGLIEEAESRVALMFEIVKFKLFVTQINGGEAPTCQAMVNGVPFQALNTAMQINAGLDIIRALQKYIGTKAPIFIDNRESTTSIPDMDCQIINLFVSPEHINLSILN